MSRTAIFLVVVHQCGNENKDSGGECSSPFLLSTKGEDIMAETVQRETLDFPDFCKTLGIGETTGRGLIRRGIVPCIRVGRRIVIPRRVVDEILSGERTLNGPQDDDHAA